MTRLKIGPQRLPRGGVIDRTQPISFRFNDKMYTGCAGDSLASALLANGVRTVARSFKFHRPRGLYSCGAEEPNGLLQIGEGAHAVPSVRAPLVELTPGLQARSQAGWPSVDFDVARSMDVLAPLWAAGFYNKTFMWPNWKVYEPVIRKLAGFGRAPTGRDPDRYESRHAHCDVLVIGAGTAGIAAARTAAADGRRVILAEQGEITDGDGSSLHKLENVRVLSRTAAVAYYDHDLVTLAEAVTEGPGTYRPREQLWLVRAGRVVLATGAIEQPLVFSNNDRPGIMLAGAALKFLRRHAIAPGREVVVATNNDSAYPAAHELRRAGVNIVALLDSRESPPEELLKEMKTLEIDVHKHCLPIDTKGFSALKSVTIATLGAGRGVTNVRKIACDALLVSGGWSPTLHLFAQAGGTLKFSETSRTFEPAGAHPSIEIVGSAAGAPSVDIGERLSPVGNTARQWVDLKHDVTVSDIELAVRENFTEVEHIKRYTTLGMSVDEGKVGQAPGIELIARARGVRPAELGHTTFRPPFVPVTLGTMVGRTSETSMRHTAAHRFMRCKQAPAPCTRTLVSGNDLPLFHAPASRANRR